MKRGTGERLRLMSSAGCVEVKWHMGLTWGQFGRQGINNCKQTRVWLEIERRWPTLNTEKEWQKNKRQRRSQNMKP